ncbi:uncharacterized protein LOC112094863, partial [Morus notabilis]|uniref:uncharacterized protein LOC112094863 n=1 Tax=Morus notabilis TaxID=981085 RepID=UPI000CED1BFD
SEKSKKFALLEEQVKKQVQELNPCHLLQSCSPVLSTQQPAQPQEIQNQTHVLDQKLQPEKQSLSALSEKPKEFALLGEEVNKQVEEQNPCHQLQSCSPMLSTQQPAQPPKIQNHTHVLDQKLQLEKQSLSAPVCISFS